MIEGITGLAAQRELLLAASEDTVWQCGPIRFEVFDGLWDEFDYAPYERLGLPAGSTIRPEHGHRRIVGFSNDVPASVTDLPADYRLPNDLHPGLQWFTVVGDFVAWVVETCRHTRFTTIADEWSIADRFEAAFAATLFGLAWVLDSALVDDPNDSVNDNRDTIRSFTLSVEDFSTWWIFDGDGQRLSEADVTALLPQQLFDFARVSMLDFQTLTAS